MIGNRVIDNAAVALAAINRPPVRNARLLALGYPHPHNSGARLFGVANDRSFHLRVGGPRQRRGRARTRHARHLPRGRLLASRRQHPRPARRCPANGGQRPCADLGHTHSLRGADGAGNGHLPTRAQDRPRRPSRPSRGRRARDHAPNASRTNLPSGQPEPAPSLRHPPVARKGDITSWKAYAPAQANKIAIEAVGPGAPRRAGHRRPSTRAATPSSLGCYPGQMPNTASPYPIPVKKCAPFFAPTPRNTPPNTKPKP